MKPAEVRRFANEEVVGQRTDGLFFEGLVKEKDGRPIVVESDKGPIEALRPEEIKWLVVASRYC